MIAAGEHAENEIRKDFTLSERDAIRRTLEEQIGNRQGQRTDKELVANCPQVEPGEKTRDLTAEQAGFENVTEARRVREVADKGTPALAGVMDAGHPKSGTGDDVVATHFWIHGKLLNFAARNLARSTRPCHRFIDLPVSVAARVAELPTR